MSDRNDITTTADGWLTFLGKLALLRQEAERRGLSEIVESTDDTTAAVLQRLKSKTH
jgi:hypothetical protein